MRSVSEIFLLDVGGSEGFVWRISAVDAFDGAFLVHALRT